MQSLKQNTLYTLAFEYFQNFRLIEFWKLRRNYIFLGNLKGTYYFFLYILSNEYHYTGGCSF